jgi:hypothetical protein
VGVDQGLFSAEILETWRGARLISVDWWHADPDDAEGVAEQERRFAIATERLGAFGERSQIWRRESSEAAGLLEPRSVDFVYVDAGHTYEEVRADLESWFDRIRPGGLFSGHDYTDGPGEGGMYGVKTAVDEFCAERGLRVHHTRRELPYARSWLVQVP